MYKRFWLAIVAALLPTGLAIWATEPQSGSKSLESFEQSNLAREIFNELETEAAKAESLNIDRMALWSKNWLHAQIAFRDQPEQIAAACKAHLNRMEKLALIAAQRIPQGEVRTLESKMSRFYVLEALAQVRQAESERSQPQSAPGRMQLLHGKR